MELPRRADYLYTWCQLVNHERATTASSSQAGGFTISDTGRYGGYGLGEIKVRGDLKPSSTPTKLSNCTKVSGYRRHWYAPIPRRLLPQAQAGRGYSTTTGNDPCSYFFGGRSMWPACNSHRKKIDEGIRDQHRKVV